jgi:integrase/recombinase XerD
MPKARPITEAEFRRAIALTSETRYPERNRAILILSARAGMRIGEIQGLDLADVWDSTTKEVRDRMFLAAVRTKWGHAREVFLNKTARRALEQFLELRGIEDGPLFVSQNRRRFGRSALVSHVRALYARGDRHLVPRRSRAVHHQPRRRRGLNPDHTESCWPQIIGCN